MKLSQRALALAGLALAIDLAASGGAFAFGALAVQSNHGGAIGWAHNYSSKDDAEEEALVECGPGCTVVLDFWNGCGAYAADQAHGSTAYGWASGESRDEAENSALSQCEDHGGDACVVKVWACE